MTCRDSASKMLTSDFSTSHHIVNCLTLQAIFPFSNVNKHLKEPESLHENIPRHHSATITSIPCLQCRYAARYATKRRSCARIAELNPPISRAADPVILGPSVDDVVSPHLTVRQGVLHEPPWSKMETRRVVVPTLYTEYLRR